MAKGRASLTSSGSFSAVKVELVPDEVSKSATFFLARLSIEHELRRHRIDREARKRLGAKARQFVMENYDWSKNMRKLEDLLRA